MSELDAAIQPSDFTALVTERAEVCNCGSAGANSCMDQRGLEVFLLDCLPSEKSIDSSSLEVGPIGLKQTQESVRQEQRRYICRVLYAKAMRR
jgi:hypothetical protein